MDVKLATWAVTMATASEVNDLHLPYRTVYRQHALSSPQTKMLLSQKVFDLTTYNLAWMSYTTRLSDLTLT